MRCLRYGHALTRCERSNYCNQSDCKSEHNRLLHDHAIKPNLSINACSIGAGSVALNTVAIRVEGPKGYMDTYALVDNGSEATIFQHNLMDTVGIRGRPTDVTLLTINGSHHKSMCSADVKISAIEESTTVIVNDALISPKWTSNNQ